MFNNKRIITPILIITIFMSMLPKPSVSAFDRNEHDEYLSEVLFRSFKNIDTVTDLKTKNNIKALECASYLAIDQYNGHGSEDLSYLKQYGVKDLPSSIKEIDYTAGAYHRRATHRGWSAETTGVYNTADNNRWIIRKKILLETTDKIFDFKENSSKQDSFCALVYYTHILGDRIADKKYYPNADIMELGGRTDKQDITHELIHHITILFSGQKSTHKYNHVISKLYSYDSKIKKLFKKNHDTLSEDDYVLYNEYAKEIMEVLTYNLPEMLREEDFFKEVFYP